MDTWKICGLALLCLVSFSVVRQWGRDFEVPMKLAAAVVFLGILLGMAIPLISWIREMLSVSAVSEYAELLLGALGIAVVTGVCADLCRDCREPTVASYVETAGRLEILILSIPLIREILDAVGQLPGVG